MSTEVQEEKVGETAVEQETADSFAAGFDETPGDPPAVESKTTEQAPAEPVAPVPETPAAGPTPFAMTKEVFDQLQQQINSLSHVPEDVRKAHGTIGELKRTQQELRQLLDSVKQTGGQGGVALTQVQFKRLAEQFPEVASLLSADLNEATGTPAHTEAAPDVLGADKVKEMVDAAVASVKAENQTQAQKAERKLLGLMHSDWESVVSAPEFKTWIDGRPERDEFNNSWDSEYIAKVLNSYKADAKAAAEAKAKADADAQQSQGKPTNKKRLEAALTPAGNPTSGAPQLSENDLFRAGFSTG